METVTTTTTTTAVTAAEEKENVNRTYFTLNMFFIQLFNELTTDKQTEMASKKCILDVYNLL